MFLFLTGRINFIYLFIYLTSAEKFSLDINLPPTIKIAKSKKSKRLISEFITTFPITVVCVINFVQ